MKRICLFAFIVLLCVSCSPEPHVHEFSNDWSYDEGSHWHEAVCGDTDEVSSYGSHVWGEPYVITYATLDTNGSIGQKCDLCGYEKTQSSSKAQDDGPGWSEFIDDPTFGRVLVKYDANGKKLKETLFHSNGNVKQESSFDPASGMKTGVKQYFENGNPSYEETYWPGTLVVNFFISYDISGSRVENTCDANGTSYKTVRYNSNNQKTMEEVFDEGYPVSRTVYKIVDGKAVLDYEIQYGYSSFEKFVYDDNGEKISYSDKYFTGTNIQINHTFYRDGVPNVIYDYDENGLIYHITTISLVDGSYIEEFFNEYAIKYLQYNRDANGLWISDTHYDPVTGLPQWTIYYEAEGEYTIDTYDSTGSFVQMRETKDFYDRTMRLTFFYSEGVMKSDSFYDGNGVLTRVNRFRENGTLSKIEYYDGEGTWFKTVYYKEDGVTVDHEEP